MTAKLDKKFKPAIHFGPQPKVDYATVFQASIPELFDWTNRLCSTARVLMA